MASTLVRQHNKTVLSYLERGDMVEFPRWPYSHWAVYVGNGDVVHLAGYDNDGLNANIHSGHLFTICGQRFKKAFVRKDDFFKVADQSKAMKNNDKDKKLTPKTGKEIVEECLAMIGEIGYNVLWENCEHFASFCRYGVAKSDQVDKVLKWVAVGALGAAIGGLALGFLGNALRSSPDSDEEDEQSFKGDKLCCHKQRYNETR